jgi:hypothetical protein
VTVLITSQVIARNPEIRLVQAVVINQMSVIVLTDRISRELVTDLIVPINRIARAMESRLESLQLRVSQGAQVIVQDTGTGPAMVIDQDIFQIAQESDTAQVIDLDAMSILTSRGITTGRSM